MGLLSCFNAAGAERAVAERAIGCGDAEGLLALVSSNPHLLLRRVLPQKQTIWHSIARHGKMELFEVLVDHVWRTVPADSSTAVIDPQRRFQGTLHATIVEALSTTDKLHRTPLHVCAAEGHAECASALIQAGVDPWAQDKPFARSALHYAASKCHPAIIHAILSAPRVRKLMFKSASCVRRTDASLVSSSSSSPSPRFSDDCKLAELAGAPSAGAGSACTSKLVKLVDLPTLAGFTPLHVAAAHKSASCVEALLAYGADPNARSWGSYQSSSEVLTQVLPPGSTPLHCSSLACDFATAQLMMTHYATHLKQHDITDPRLVGNVFSQRPFQIGDSKPLALRRVLHPETLLADIIDPFREVTTPIPPPTHARCISTVVPLPVPAVEALAPAPAPAPGATLYNQALLQQTAPLSRFLPAQFLQRALVRKVQQLHEQCSHQQMGGGGAPTLCATWSGLQNGSLQRISEADFDEITDLQGSESVGLLLPDQQAALSATARAAITNAQTVAAAAAAAVVSSMHHSDSSGQVSEGSSSSPSVHGVATITEESNNTSRGASLWLAASKLITSTFTLNYRHSGEGMAKAVHTLHNPSSITHHIAIRPAPSAAASISATSATSTTLTNADSGTLVSFGTTTCSSIAGPSPTGSKPSTPDHDAEGSLGVSPMPMLREHQPPPALPILPSPEKTRAMPIPRCLPSLPRSSPMMSATAPGGVTAPPAGATAPERDFSTGMERRHQSLDMHAPRLSAPGGGPGRQQQALCSPHPARPQLRGVSLGGGMRASLDVAFVAADAAHRSQGLPVLRSSASWRGSCNSPPPAVGAVFLDVEPTSAEQLSSCSGTRDVTLLPCNNPMITPPSVQQAHALPSSLQRFDSRSTAALPPSPSLQRVPSNSLRPTPSGRLDTGLLQSSPSIKRSAVASPLLLPSASAADESHHQPPRMSPTAPGPRHSISGFGAAFGALSSPNALFKSPSMSRVASTSIRSNAWSIGADAAGAGASTQVAPQAATGGRTSGDGMHGAVSDGCALMAGGVRQAYPHTRTAIMAMDEAAGQ